MNSYKLVNLGELYPGITVKLKAKGGNIEKLFFLKPRANPNDISVCILGSDKIIVNKNDDLNNV